MLALAEPGIDDNKVYAIFVIAIVLFFIGLFVFPDKDQ